MSPLIIVTTWWSRGSSRLRLTLSPFFFFGSHVNPLATLLWTHSVLFSMASSFTLDRLLARTGVEGQRHAFKSRWRGKGGVKRFEGGWGRRGKRERESGGGG